MDGSVFVRLIFGKWFRRMQLIHRRLNELSEFAWRKGRAQRVCLLSPSAYSASMGFVCIRLQLNFSRVARPMVQVVFPFLVYFCFQKFMWLYEQVSFDLVRFFTVHRNYLMYSECCCCFWYTQFENMHECTLFNYITVSYDDSRKRYSNRKKIGNCVWVCVCGGCENAFHVRMILCKRFQYQPHNHTELQIHTHMEIYTRTRHIYEFHSGKNCFYRISNVDGDSERGREKKEKNAKLLFVWVKSFTIAILYVQIILIVGIYIPNEKKNILFS